MLGSRPRPDIKTNVLHQTFDGSLIGTKQQFDTVEIFSAGQSWRIVLCVQTRDNSRFKGIAEVQSHTFDKINAKLWGQAQQQKRNKIWQNFKPFSLHCIFICKVVNGPLYILK